MRRTLVGIGLVLVVVGSGCGSKARAHVATTTLDEKASANAVMWHEVIDRKEFRCLQHNGTTYSMGVCLNAAFDRAETRILNKERTINHLFLVKSAGRVFTRSERDWREYREKAAWPRLRSIQVGHFNLFLLRAA